MASVTQLMPNEIARVDRRLPLNRLCQQVEQGSTYLIAWKDDQPVGHVHIARRWTTHSSVSRSFSERSARDFGQLQSGIGLSRCW